MLVNPRSNGFGGGSYTRADRPTAVQGPFSSPGASAPNPISVNSAGIIEARNNKGSNVQVPYARLVPTRTFTSLADKKSKAGVYGGQFEYEGLEKGNLAWVLGRRFDPQSDTTPFHMPAGNGVDRMQRLASTKWMEEQFKTNSNNVSINLSTLQINTDNNKKMDSSIKSFSSVLRGSTATDAVDVTRLKIQMLGNTEPTNASQGINILSVSPFLCGKNSTDSLLVAKPKGKQALAIERNMGDALSFAALDIELRKNRLMDWTPDGIVLSKLESPSDDPMRSGEIDHRQGQLFNVGIQGPAISTVWTSELKDHKLQVQPLDKVFMCIYATVNYELIDENKQSKAVATLNNMEDRLAKEVFLSRLVRDNEIKVDKAELQGFELKRTTSSHMINYSHFTDGNDDTRLGMKFKSLETVGDTNVRGSREVIVGGWCIGTVLDSAASRSSIGIQTVKSHPTTMAVNVNVNVQWWSGNQLNKHYMDHAGSVLSRTTKKRARNDDVLQKVRDEKLDKREYKPALDAYVAQVKGYRAAKEAAAKKKTTGPTP